MDQQRIWILRLAPARPHGRLILGLTLFCMLLPIFYFGSSNASSPDTPTLFFSLAIAYIVPVFSYITDISCKALHQLKPLLSMDSADFDARLNQLVSTTPQRQLLHLLLGIVLGLSHISLVSGSVILAAQRSASSFDGFVSTLGSLLVWLVMTTVISMLIQQALVFARLGSSMIKLPLFNTYQLLPFGRVSISSSLAIIGALSLFPILGAETGLDLMTILPGAVAMLLPLMLIFFMPVWPIHRRMTEARQQRLMQANARIDEYINRNHEADLEHDIPATLSSMLIYRREVADIPTWPFDFDNVSKLALYMIIPPLTWVAAALIENLVDSLL